LISGSCASAACEPRQDRKVATVSGNGIVLGATWKEMRLLLAIEEKRSKYGARRAHIPGIYGY